MTPLCSILIPTRGRLDRLKSAIASICFNAPKNGEFEFVLRIDDDESADVTHWANHVDHAVIKLIVGPRGKGYADLYKFYAECAARASGKYVWIFNDDTEIIGPWFERLSEAPDRAFIQPDTYQLNGSIYTKCEDIGFPIVPRDSWLEYEYDTKPNFPNQVDLGLYNVLVRDGKWPVHFLSGVTVRHSRIVDNTLPKGRL